MRVITCFIIFFLLLSCQSEPSQKGIIRSVEENFKTVLEPNKVASIYQYDSTYLDSTLIAEWFYYNDSIAKQGERFYYGLPFESEFVWPSIIDAARGETELETFDSLICEVGGTSAWNKYIFEYDQLNRVKQIKHMKAWWYEGLGEYGERPDKPAYFLGETINFEYQANQSLQRTYDENNTIIEHFEKRYDREGLLIFEHCETWSEYRYKAYYNYN